MNIEVFYSDGELADFSEIRMKRCIRRHEMRHKYPASIVYFGVTGTYYALMMAGF